MWIIIHLVARAGIRTHDLLFISLLLTITTLKTRAPVHDPLSL